MILLQDSTFVVLTGSGGWMLEVEVPMGFEGTLEEYLAWLEEALPHSEFEESSATLRVCHRLSFGTMEESFPLLPIPKALHSLLWKSYQPPPPATPTIPTPPPVARQLSLAMPKRGFQLSKTSKSKN